jgi:hypothetical protein
MWVPKEPRHTKGSLPMARIINALNSILRPERDEIVHFHSTEYEDRPEVCYDRGCSRPRLSA